MIPDFTTAVAFIGAGFVLVVPVELLGLLLFRLITVRDEE